MTSLGRGIVFLFACVGCRHTPPAILTATVPEEPLSGRVCTVSAETAVPPALFLREARRASEILRARTVTFDSARSRIVIVGDQAPLAGPPPGRPGVLYVEMQLYPGEDSTRAWVLAVSPGVSNWLASKTKAEGDSLATRAAVFARRVLRAMPSAPTYKLFCYGDVE